MVTITRREEESTSKPPGRPAKPQNRGKRRLSMSVVNFWLDTAILIALMFLGWIAAVLEFLFPAPTLAGGWTLWGLTYDQWHDIEFASLCVFALGVLVHVMLHWNWVCSVVFAQILHSKERPDEGKQTIYGVVVLTVLLHIIGVGVMIAIFFIHRPPPPI